MTISETFDILKTRLGWRDDGTVDGFALTPPNSTTDSGRYFQSEHSAITLQNIRDCQPLIDVGSVDFNSYLQNLTEQVVRKVLGDVFETDYVDDDFLTKYPTALDSVISLRMTIDVAELIITSIRSNRIKRLGDEFVGKLHYDIFREAPNQFAIRKLNYKHSLGITTRYEYELDSVQRRFGQQRNLLRSITRGQSINDIYE